ncbi:MAG: hypothetical protein WC125_12855 [Bacteroidales bacterium]
MGFRKLRIAPINSWVSEDGYPVYGPFVKLQDAVASNELNSVELTITNVTKEKTFQADDKEEVKKVVVRAEGTLKVYECIPSVCREMFGYAVDANGNTIEKLNSTNKKRYGVFFEGKTAKDAKYQKYIYDVEFEEISPTFSTDTGEDAPTLEIPFKVRFIEVEGNPVRSATVYEGNNGWVSGEPAIMYKGAEVQGGLIPLNAPIISLDEDDMASWAAIPNATNYVVVVNGTAQAAQSELVFPAITEPGSYSVHVIAKGDGTTYGDSANSNVVSYTITD